MAQVGGPKACGEDTPTRSSQKIVLREERDAREKMILSRENAGGGFPKWECPLSSFLEVVRIEAFNLVGLSFGYADTMVE